MLDDEHFHFCFSSSRRTMLRFESNHFSPWFVVGLVLARLTSLSVWKGWKLAPGSRFYCSAFYGQGFLDSRSKKLWKSFCQLFFLPRLFSLMKLGIETFHSWLSLLFFTFRTCLQIIRLLIWKVMFLCIITITAYFGGESGMEYHPLKLVLGSSCFRFTNSDHFNMYLWVIHEFFGVYLRICSC